MTKEKLTKTYYRLRIGKKSYIVWGIGIIVDFGVSLMMSGQKMEEYKSVALVRGSQN